MELIVYNRELVPLGLVEKITSFIWVRRYWRSGEFQLLVPFTPHHVRMLKMHHIIIKQGDSEAGEIRHIQIRQNTQGLEEIEVRGRFLTSWIGKRIVAPQIIANDTMPNIINRIVAENVTNPSNSLRRIDNITHTGISHIQRNRIDYKTEPFINALLAVETAARASTLGFQIITDIRQSRHFFRIYDGNNLAIDQQINPPAIFSAEFENVLEQEFTHNTESLGSTAFVGGEERHDMPRRVVEVGATASGLDRAEVFINATDIVQSWRDEDGTEHFIPSDQYDALLFQRGVQTLNLFAENIAFASKVNQHSNLQYKVDYDLGDRVTCDNKRWGVRINVRITEIMEVYQNSNIPEIDITFGDSLPAIIDQIRLIAYQKG